MYKEGCFAVYPREVTWKKNANVAKKVALSFASTRKREGKTRSIEKSELETWWIRIVAIRIYSIIDITAGWISILASVNLI